MLKKNPRPCSSKLLFSGPQVSPYQAIGKGKSGDTNKLVRFLRMHLRFDILLRRMDPLQAFTLRPVYRGSSRTFQTEVRGRRLLV